jgi:hypothetical protein
VGRGASTPPGYSMFTLEAGSVALGGVGSARSLPMRGDTPCATHKNPLPVAVYGANRRPFTS